MLLAAASVSSKAYDEDTFEVNAQLVVESEETKQPMEVAELPILQQQQQQAEHTVNGSLLSGAIQRENSPIKIAADTNSAKTGGDSKENGRGTRLSGVNLLSIGSTKNEAQQQPLRNSEEIQGKGL